MSIIQGPQTVQDFERVKATIVGLMNNKYCDPGMYANLQKRLEKTEAKIIELKTA